MKIHHARPVRDIVSSGASGLGISAHTKLTAVFGTPLKHSMSPTIHNAIYRTLGKDAVLLAFESKNIADIMSAMRALPIHMGAFTIPLKQVVMPYLDSISEEARAIGSVNTVINDGDRLLGYNTDIVGIAASLPTKDIKGKKVLIVGAGGVAQPIAYHLQKSAAKIFCNNRESAMAETLCARWGGTVIDREHLGDVKFDVVINATPLGSSPYEDKMAVPEEMLRKGMTIFDVIYAPPETKLTKVARAKGCKVVTGVKMFVAQAIEQERLWLKRDIPDEGYTELVEKTLARMHPRTH